MKNITNFINEALDQNALDHILSYCIDDIDIDELYERTNGGEDVDDLINWMYKQFSDNINELDPKEKQIVKSFKNPTEELKNKISEYVNDILKDY